MGRLIPLNSFPQIYVDCDIPNTLFVIDTLLQVMNEDLPIQNVQPTVIALDEKRDCPVCFKESNLIFLAASPFSWSRIAYQLAHEMCHQIISNKVAQNLRWLEESICELASYYFLPKLSEYWRINQINFETTNGELYYPCFKTYVEDNSQKAIPFEISQLCQIPETQIIKDLALNPYIRNMNAHIANSLFPIFSAHPHTWNAVPFLCNVVDRNSLSEVLQEWIHISPQECHDGLFKISRLFGLSESL